MSIELRDTAASIRGNMSTVTDEVLENFRTAVNNGQVRLALEYAVKIIDSQQRIITDLQENAALQPEPEPEPVVEEKEEKPTPKKPVKKPAAKKAPARKVGGKNPPKPKAEDTSEPDNEG